MVDAAVAPAPAPVIDPAAPVIDPLKKAEEIAPVVDDPFEFDLDIGGKSQKLKFQNKDQLKAVLQKALYADQVIKDASQAKKGAAELMAKIKTPQGLREVLQDPDINMDVKKFALDIVREMMDDEKLTPEQRELRELQSYKKQKEEEGVRAKADAAAKAAQEKETQQATVVRGEIIGAMKKYPDIPQTQATMDAVIQNMRAAYQRFGKHLTAEQAMTVYSEQYWTSLQKILDTLPPEKILERFGKKTLDKIQQLKLNELRKATDPNKKPIVADTDVKKKKHLTEKEFDKHFQTLAGGL